MIDRPLYVDKIMAYADTPFVKILTGVRRCGKSTILKMIMERLKTERNIPAERMISCRYDSMEFEDMTAKQMYAQLKEWAEENFDITKWYPDGKLPAFYSEREGMKGWNLFQLMHRKARGDDVGNSTFGGKNYCAESNGNAADTLMLCASWVAQTDLSEFFKKWNPGASAYQLPGATEMSFQGGVSSSAYSTLASLKLPKPEKGPETINKVTEHKMSAE